MKLLDVLKTLPIDLGQGHLRTKTKGKLIALSLIKNGKGKKVLDIGCREGAQSEWLKQRGYEVTSIDIEKKYRYCRVVDANKRLPFKDNSFDLIWCSEVIEHLEDPAKSLAEFRRVLKPGGELIITTPNSYCLVFRIMSLFGLTPKKIQNPTHIQFFNFKDIKRLFPEGNVYGFFPYVILKLRIKRFVGPLSPTFVIYEKK